MAALQTNFEDFIKIGVLSHFGKTGVYAGHCFIIHLLGGGQCPLVRDSESIRLLEMPTSPSLYMLIIIIIVIDAAAVVLIVVVY